MNFRERLLAQQAKPNPFYRINLISAPCGSGKTFNLCRTMAKRRTTVNQLYVAPTLKLLNEVDSELRKLGLTPHKITSESSSGRVTSSIVDIFNNTLDFDQILLITHNAFANLDFIPSLWEIYFDEVPQLDRFIKYALPEHNGLLRQHFKLGPKQGGLRAVQATDTANLRKWLRQPSDTVNDLFRELAQSVLSDNWVCWTDEASWEKVVANRIVTRGEGENTVYFLIVLSPRRYFESTIIGANAESSLLAKHFLKTGAHFTDQPNISKGLRHLDHSKGNLKIFYFFQRPFSKYHGNRTVGDKTNFQAMDRWVADKFKSKDFLYVCNNDREPDLPNGIKIPTIAHGLNEYRHHDALYFSSALNREPKHTSMLRELGLNSEDAYVATACEAAYQATMRTKLRTSGWTGNVDIVVPDYSTAAYISALVPGSEIAQIPGFDGDAVVVPSFSQADRDKRKRANKVLSNLFDQETPQPSSFKDTRGVLVPANPQGIAVTLSRYAKASERSDFVRHTFDSVSSLTQVFRTLARSPVRSKTDCALFQPTVFGDAEVGYRRQDNFVRSSFMVLDFDNGSLSPNEFIELFGNRAVAEKRSFLICNSFSRSDKEPNRFRALMFYTAAAENLDQHRAVYDHVVQVLQNHGHKNSGLDKGCRSGVQQFYLPCTRQGFEDWALFETAHTSQRDVKRYGFDPRQMTPARPTTTTVATPRRRVVTDGHLQALIAEFTSMTEGRRHIVFKIAQAYAQRGFSEDQTRVQLMALVGHIPHHRNNVPEIISWLREHGRFQTFGLPPNANAA